MYLFQGYIRIAKCSLALGDLSAADNAISTVKELSPDNANILQEFKKLEIIRRFEEEGNKAYQKQDYRKVIIFGEIVCYTKNYLLSVPFFFVIFGCISEKVFGNHLLVSLYSFAQILIELNMVVELH
jgi:hypothetical protein